MDAMTAWWRKSPAKSLSCNSTMVWQLEYVYCKYGWVWQLEYVNCKYGRIDSLMAQVTWKVTVLQLHYGMAARICIL